MKRNLLKGIMGGLALAVYAMPIHADGVKWLEKCLDASKIEITQGSNVITPTIGNGVVKVSGTSNNELKVTLKPGANMSMTNGQTFVVVEANTTFDKTKKLDHLVSGDNYLVNKTGNLLGFNKEANGHKLTVFCLLDKRGGY